MRRRAFLATAVGAAAAPLGLRGPLASASTPGDAGRVLTVRGPIVPSQMGVTLVHEHALVDFAGAGRVSPSRYDAQEVFRLVLPHLEEIRQRGCRTFVDCTPDCLGRDPLLLQRLSEASGLQILTNTGYYGAAGDRHLPPHVRRETAGELARRWRRELRDGIGRTGVRPGFLKIGVDAGPLSDVDRKLVEAAAACHLETGLAIAVHTDDGRAALATLAALKRASVSPEAWIWVHASKEKDRAIWDSVAREGGFVELDNLTPDTLASSVDAVLEMSRRGLLGRTLVSQDAGWYEVGKPRGGRYRSHATLFDAFVPALRAAGLGEREVRQLLVENPARAFTIRVRPASGRPDERGKAVSNA